MTTPLIGYSRTAWLFAGAGVALFVAQAVLPVLPDDSAGKVSVIQAHRSTFVLSAVSFLVAALLLIAAVAAVNRVPVGRGRKLTRVGLLLTAAGALWPVAGRATFNLVMLAITGGADRGVATQAAQAIDNSGVFSLLLLTLLAFAVGPIVLTVGLWRAGEMPVWPAVLWLLGVLTVNASDTSSRAIAALGMAVAAAGLGWLGAAACGEGTPLSLDDTGLQRA
jgi:hypothetical protein